MTIFIQEIHEVVTHWKSRGVGLIVVASRIIVETLSLSYPHSCTIVATFFNIASLCTFPFFHFLSFAYFGNQWTNQNKGKKSHTHTFYTYWIWIWFDPSSMIFEKNGCGFDLDLLFISHQLCVSYPRRRRCKAKKSSLGTITLLHGEPPSPTPC